MKQKNRIEERVDLANDKYKLKGKKGGETKNSAKRMKMAAAKDKEEGEKRRSRIGKRREI